MTTQNGLFDDGTLVAELDAANDAIAVNKIEPRSAATVSINGTTIPATGTTGQVLSLASPGVGAWTSPSGGAFAPDYNWSASGSIPASGASALTLQDPAGSEFGIPNNSGIRLEAMVTYYDATGNVFSTAHYVSAWKNVSGTVTQIGSTAVLGSSNVDSATPSQNFIGTIGSGAGSVQFIANGTHVRFQAQSSAFDSNAITCKIRVSIWES